VLLAVSIGAGLCLHRGNLQWQGLFLRQRAGVLSRYVPHRRATDWYTLKLTSSDTPGT
jgi:hypothetical protein